jgi:hypothetical protein
METSQLRLTPSPSALASRLPRSMRQRTVRGETLRDFAVTPVVTHPDGAVGLRLVSATSPRSVSSPMRA